MDNPGMVSGARAFGNASTDRQAALNEYQQRHLLSSCQYIDNLLGKFERIAHAPAGVSLFPRHVQALTPMQRRVLHDYVSRIRGRLLAVPATVLLSKADLLAPDERVRAAACTAEQLRQELKVEVSVHPVSVVPGHGEVADMERDVEELEALGPTGDATGPASPPGHRTGVKP